MRIFNAGTLKIMLWAIPGQTGPDRPRQSQTEPVYEILGFY